MTLHQVYGLSVGIILVLLGLALLIATPLDAALSDKETDFAGIRKKRYLWGIFIIAGGFLSISAVCLGWPPIRGYIIPPP